MGHKWVLDTAVRRNNIVIKLKIKRHKNFKTVLNNLNSSNFIEVFHHKKILKDMVFTFAKKEKIRKKGEILRIYNNLWR